jgi:hypothetical protein
MAVTFSYANLRAAGEEATMQAPSVDGYRQEAHDVLSPFVNQALEMDKEELGGSDPLFLELTTRTQERLLRLRVPKEERDSHLTFVLLLDQWKRALEGSSPDRAVVLEGTTRVVAAHPWIQ